MLNYVVDTVREVDYRALSLIDILPMVYMLMLSCTFDTLMAAFRYC